MTRTPESSVVSFEGSATTTTGPGRAAGAPGRGRGHARAAGGRGHGRCRGLRVAPVPTRALVAGAHGGELLGRLAGDLRVLGEAQADAAALAIELDDLDLHLVAAVDYVLHRVDPLTGRDVGDVQQAVGALGQLDEGAEGRRLDDLAGELVTDLDLLGHRADAVHESVALVARLGVDANRPVVVDVDLGVELLGQRPDRLAALADHRTDLLGVDLDRGDPRRVLRQLLARLGDRVLHLAEDRQARGLGLRKRVAQDVERHTRDLDVHLKGRDALRGTGDLEVHVAQVVLHARDVGEDDVVVTLLDQAHRHARDGALQRHAGVHQRERGSAHRGHRGRPVGLEDVRDHADRVGELLDRRHNRHQRPLGERSVADVAALGTAHEAGLTHRERREVVVVEVVLGLLEAERVQAHLVTRGAERGDREGLRLAAGEDGRAVRARRHSHLDPDVADLLRGTPVGALLVDRDALADDVLLELVEGQLHRAAARGVGLGLVGIARQRLEDLLLDSLGGVLALELVGHLGRLVEGRAEALLDLGEDRLVDLRRGGLHLGLAGLLLQVALGLAELLDGLVGDVERIEDLGLGDLVGACLDHQDGLFGARDDEVERGLEQPLLIGIDEEVALRVLADAHGADRHREGDVRHHQRGACAVHREDVVGVFVVYRHGDRDQLRLARPALWKERAQRPVDHSSGEGGLLSGPALTAEEAAGDLARGVHPLLHVDGQREEVDVALIARRRGAEHLGIPCRHYDRPGRLLGVLAGLELDRGAADLQRDAAHSISHMLPFGRLRLAAWLLCVPFRTRMRLAAPYRAHRETRPPR